MIDKNAAAAAAGERSLSSDEDERSRQRRRRCLLKRHDLHKEIERTRAVNQRAAELTRVKRALDGESERRRGSAQPPSPPGQI